MNLEFVKTFYGIHPHDPATEEFIQKLKVGSVVSGQFVRRRNPKFHNKFMKLCRLAHELYEREIERQEFRPTIESEYGTMEIQLHFEATREWLIKKCGYVDVFGYPDGSVSTKAKSIRFSKMNQEEFEQLYSTAIDVMIQRFCNAGYSESRFQEELNRILHFA